MLIKNNRLLDRCDRGQRFIGDGTIRIADRAPESALDWSRVSNRPRRLTRDDYAKLAVVVISCAAGTVAILVGAGSLQAAQRRGYLLLGAGLFSYGVTGMAGVALPARISWLPPALMKSSWLRLPRLAWIIGAFAALGALSNIAQAMFFVS